MVSEKTTLSILFHRYNMTTNSLYVDEWDPPLEGTSPTLQSQAPNGVLSWSNYSGLFAFPKIKGVLSRDRTAS